MARATPTGATGARTRRPSDHVTRDLLDAAAVEFAAHGFAGASTRRIAERAGAHQPQINYHFTSKEQLWRATVDHLFSLMDAALPGLGDGPTTDAAFEAVVRSFVRFSADRPELDRIINLEATAPSPGSTGWWRPTSSPGSPPCPTAGPHSVPRATGPT